MNGRIQDESFLRFLEKIGQDLLASFNTEDFLVLDLVHKERPILSTPLELKIRLNHLIDFGIVERIGKGRSACYMLCQKYYTLVGKSGIYTRKRGLDKEINKELLFKRLNTNAKNGLKYNELQQVLPFLSRRQVQKLLVELKLENRVHVEGKTSPSIWFPNIAK